VLSSTFSTISGRRKNHRNLTLEILQGSRPPPVPPKSSLRGPLNVRRPSQRATLASFPSTHSPVQVIDDFERQIEYQLAGLDDSSEDASSVDTFFSVVSPFQTSFSSDYFADDEPHPYATSEGVRSDELEADDREVRLLKGQLERERLAVKQERTLRMLAEEQLLAKGLR
jgi:hypothetical protein